jgi:hypothetical protein
MYSLQTLHINMSYVKSFKRINRTCVYEEFEENTLDMFIWRVWREYIGDVYMKSLKRIHRTCLINLSYVFSSYNMSYVFSSYKHVLCTLFKLFIYTCPVYSLQTLHINMFIWRVWREYIGHVYLKSLKRIHSTCLYEEFEENTSDMFIWKVWREYIGHVYMMSLKIPKG